MTAMFYANTQFNQPLDSFNTKNVGSMYGMFATSIYNHPLNFDTRSVTDMTAMFYVNTQFNQPLDSFNTSSVTTMKYMFHASSYNQPLDSFNTSSVTDMAYMFYASSYNHPLNFDTRSVTTMAYMFYASSYNQPVIFDVSSVTEMVVMFENANEMGDCNKKITHDSLSASSVWPYDWSSLSCFKYALDLWSSNKIAVIAADAAMYAAMAAYQGDVNTWNVSHITDMSYLFENQNFNSNISNWDTSNVVTMQAMFHNSIYNQPLNFDTSSVTNMADMFSDAEEYNQPLNFDTSRVTTMMAMFFNSEINQPIIFNVTSVTTSEMENMFAAADNMSDCNKKLTHDSLSASTAWAAAGYDWSLLCTPTSAPTSAPIP
jgi:surface protein